MTEKIGGLAGVLGHLTSDDGGVKPGPAPKEKKKTPPKTAAPAEPDPVRLRNAEKETPRPPREKLYARHGRLPGQVPDKNAEPKARVSVSVPASLLDEYRAWSWQMRCQLGDLIGRA